MHLGTTISEKAQGAKLNMPDQRAPWSCDVMEQLEEGEKTTVCGLRRNSSAYQHSKSIKRREKINENL